MTGDFRRLAARFEEGRDFEILVRRGVSNALVLAIHGGRIEPGTAEMARLVAGERHTLYLFKGIRSEGNRALHITSTRFDEPRAMALVTGADRVLSLHGCRGSDPFLVVGGRDRAGRRRLQTLLASGGYPILSETSDPLRGRHPDNICNRGARAMGIQVEVSAGLRRRLLVPGKIGIGKPRAALTDLCARIRKAIQ
ncbi:MAG: poly-gamma-glutamate hydrolase family protein [Desulfosarcinaceae bacterium]|nr:poly-gamma-glutamate hydrolase family protein [Desulfosarcinaceae bacterium]